MAPEYIQIPFIWCTLVSLEPKEGRLVLSRVQLLGLLTIACQAPRPWNFPARILKWVAIFYSRGSSLPRD